MVTSSSLDSWVKNLSKDDFKFLSHEIRNNVLDPVKHKGFYPYQYMCDFEKFKEQLPCKKKFYISLINRKITDKKYEINLEINLKWKQWNIITACI